MPYSKLFGLIGLWSLGCGYLGVCLTANVTELRLRRISVGMFILGIVLIFAAVACDFRGFLHSLAD